MTTATHSLSHDSLRFPGLAALTGPVARALLGIPFLLFGAMLGTISEKRGKAIVEGAGERSDASRRAA